MPPKEGRYEVTIDNHDIRSLDLTPFQTTVGFTSPSSGKHNKRAIYIRK